MLYDEVAMRSGEKIPYGNLKEVYQLLKEKYRQMGDNAKAGDFHYGEMEMRRREYGYCRRFLRPEFLYWALSGYGIGYIRAAVVLSLIVTGFGWLYFTTDPSVFSGNFLESLLYSIQVSTLQRPPTPQDLSVSGRWIQSLQMIIAPLQIALFALALRMRLKR